MRQHYIDKPSNPVAILFTFNFHMNKYGDRGFNQVYARDMQDAIEVAVDTFEGDDSSLKVDVKSFREVKDVNAYYDNFPLMD
jgi:hypothetical protein